MLDLDFVRKQFPGLQSEWTLFDNAGGSVPLGRVIDRVQDYMRNCGADHPNPTQPNHDPTHTTPRQPSRFTASLRDFPSGGAAGLLASWPVGIERSPYHRAVMMQPVL